MGERYMENLRHRKILVNSSFENWINEVENIVLKHTIYNLLDFADEDYMTNFMNHISPSKMASIVLEQLSFS